MGKYIIRPDSLPTYSPAAHQETKNRRLVGRENVGAKNIEMVVGETQEGGLAEPHFHDVEQVAYLLEGRARVEIGGEVGEIKAGEAYFAPPKILHQIANIGGKTKWLVVYSPPLASAGDDSFKKPGSKKKAP